jgi:glycosyltransferase involved in cell wall biosynthesis
VPVLVFSELTPWSDAELSPLQRRVHRLIAPRAAGFVVAGSQGVERLRAMGVDVGRVEVALQSADLDGLRRGAARPAGGAARLAGGAAEQAHDAPVRVLTVGRLVPDKGLDVLVDAFAQAGFHDGEAELEIRGSGPLEAELRARAQGLGVPLGLPGPATPEQLGEVYSAASVLALVSSYEPFGVALREGAAAGLPLIASRRAGAVGDIAVEGENAIVIEPGDRGQIAEALRRLVREPDLRERLAAGSRAVTERHPPEADVEAWERAILRALDR